MSKSVIFMFPPCSAIRNGNFVSQKLSNIGSFLSLNPAKCFIMLPPLLANLLFPVSYLDRNKYKQDKKIKSIYLLNKLNIYHMLGNMFKKWCLILKELMDEQGSV